MDDGGQPTRSVADLRNRAPGADPADPYEDVDVSSLPAWWRRAIDEFEAFGLRPYRPPRFEDGTPKHEVVADVEAELDVEVAVRGVDVTRGDDWTVYVDDRAVGTIGRRRSPEGYSVFEGSGEAFARRIRAAVEGAAGRRGDEGAGRGEAGGSEGESGDADAGRTG